MKKKQFRDIQLCGGVSASVHAGIPPPPREQTPPRADTPRGSRHPPGSRNPPPRAGISPGADTPPKADTPPSRLQHTVNERPVRILLECILVYLFIYFFIYLFVYWFFYILVTLSLIELNLMKEWGITPTSWTFPRSPTANHPPSPWLRSSYIDCMHCASYKPY